MNKITIEKYKGDIEPFKNDFLNQNDVKFIILNDKYLNLSSDTSINEIHKFKSEYNSKRYIILPIKIKNLTKMTSNEKRKAFEISLIPQEKNCDGYMCISKLNVFKTNKILTRYPKITQDIGIEICLKEMRKYNHILSGNISVAKESLEDGTTKEVIIYENEIVEPKQFVINKNNTLVV